MCYSVDPLKNQNLITELSSHKGFGVNRPVVIDARNSIDGVARRFSLRDRRDQLGSAVAEDIWIDRHPSGMHSKI